ncbi:MAG: endonuclease/exonuclease/phosphatase family protein [Clostridia bacterium]|nr:endonuclease/exonuclease/phosphatase family protein [Clostridia bacterium]
MRRFLLCAVTALMCAGVIACQKAGEETTFVATHTPAPTATPQAVTLVHSPSPTPTPVPTFTPTPTPTPSENDLVPTQTPQITFVPLPQSVHTPDKRGNTPTPTPAWASPIPTPLPEEPGYVTVPETITLATVKGVGTKGMHVRSRTQHRGYNLGTARDGQQFTVLEPGEQYTKVLFEGQEGYIDTANLDFAEVSTAQKGVIEYTIGSLNVHGIRSTARFNRLVEVLKTEQLDIVGIQELFRGSTDWLINLAEAAGYPYWTFTRTCTRDSADYGTAILSKYPIVLADSRPLTVWRGKEPRGIGYAGVLMPKGLVHMFNTHLCASTMYQKSVNIASMAYTLRAYKVGPYTVTGDFNCSPPRIFRYLPEIRFANMDKTTFKSTSNAPKIIDNILYTEGIAVSDFRLVDTISTEATDHMFLRCKVHVLIPENGK